MSVSQPFIEQLLLSIMGGLVLAAILGMFVRSLLDTISHETNVLIGSCVCVITLALGLAGALYNTIFCVPFAFMLGLLCVYGLYFFHERVDRKIDAELRHKT